MPILNVTQLEGTPDKSIFSVLPHVIGDLSTAGGSVFTTPGYNLKVRSSTAAVLTSGTLRMVIDSTASALIKTILLVLVGLYRRAPLPVLSTSDDAAGSAG